MIAELKKLTRLSAIYGMGRLLSSVIGFVLIPIYTRYLTPADYGLYSLYAIAGQVVTLISLMGMSTAMFREVVYHDSDERTVISTTFNFLIIQSLVFFGVLAIFSPQISLLLFGEATHTYLLRLIFITNGLGVFGFVVLSTLQMREQAGRYSAVHVIRFAIGVALNILFIVVLRMGLEGLVLAGLGMSILSAIMFVALLWKDLRPRLSWPILKRMLRFGLPLVPFQLASILLTSSDRYFLEHYAGAAEVGIYSLGYKFGMIVQLIVMAIQTAWAAQMFAIAKEDGAERKFARIVVYYLAGLGFLGLGISVLSKEVLTIMSTPAFLPAYTVVPLIVLSYIAYGGVNMTNVALNIKGRTELNAPIIIAVAIGNLGLNYLLIPRFGMMGAAVATLVSYVVLLVIEVIVNQRVWRLPLEYGRILKVALAWGTVYAVSLLIASGNVWLDTGLKTCLLVAFPVLLFVFGFFDASELRALRVVSQRLLRRLRPSAGSEQA